MDNWNRMGLMLSNCTQSYRDMQASDEYMAGRKEMAIDLQNLVVKYVEIEDKLAKERKKTHCQESTVARMEKILTHIRKTLAGKGIDVNDPNVRANSRRVVRPCFRCSHQHSR